MEPRFSLIIPSYNRAATLGRAIESILLQTYPAFEIIVVDDGSTDQTRQVLEAFPQVTYYYQENQGVSAARNRGAEMATGDWLIFLDSDDELLNDSLEKFSKSMIKNQTSRVFRSGLILVKNGQEYPYFLSKENFVGQIPGTFVISRSFFFELGGYDINLKFGENTELFFRVDWSGEVPVLLDDLGLRYHQNSSGANSNLINVTDALLLILSKHDAHLDKKVKRLYLQILGVNYIRLRRFPAARKYLFKAFFLNPFKLDTLVRWVIACLPELAKRVYSPFPLKK